MKSQKGITLTSLAIYIVIIFIVIAILANITTNIQKGLSNSGQEGVEIADINKFNLVFLKEVKRQGNRINFISQNRIEFSSGIFFVFENEAIKTNNGSDLIVIAKDIESCVFSSNIENGKTVISVSIEPNNINTTIENEYVLSPEEQNSNYEVEEDYIS